MKTWNTPDLTVLSITETAHLPLGNDEDGGYVGDGIVSGHQSINGKCASWCPICYGGDNNSGDNGGTEERS